MNVNDLLSHSSVLQWRARYLNIIPVFSCLRAKTPAVEIMKVSCMFFIVKHLTLRKL